jgi:hypothetical protein
MPKIIELSQSLNAKLCHDLAGSIGTVDNCLSLIENDNEEISNQAKELAVVESANLVKRIKFFRTVYGLSEGENKFSLVNLSKLLQDFFVDTNTKLSMEYATGIIYINSMTAKAIICLAVIAGDATVSGGEVMISIPESDEILIIIKSIGKNIVIKESSLNVLKGAPGIPVAVDNCREHYINAICAHRDYKLKVIKSTDLLEFRINKK